MRAPYTAFLHVVAFDGMLLGIFVLILIFACNRRLPVGLCHTRLFVVRLAILWHCCASSPGIGAKRFLFNVVVGCRLGIVLF